MLIHGGYLVTIQTIHHYNSSLFTKKLARINQNDE